MSAPEEGRFGSPSRALLEDSASSYARMSRSRLLSAVLRDAVNESRRLPPRVCAQLPQAKCRQRERERGNPAAVCQLSCRLGLVPRLRLGRVLVVVLRGVDWTKHRHLPGGNRASVWIDSSCLVLEGGDRGWNRRGATCTTHLSDPLKWSVLHNGVPTDEKQYQTPESWFAKSNRKGCPGPAQTGGDRVRAFSWQLVTAGLRAKGAKLLQMHVCLTIQRRPAAEGGWPGEAASSAEPGVSPARRYRAPKQTTQIMDRRLKFSRKFPRTKESHPSESRIRWSQSPRDPDSQLADWPQPLIHERLRRDIMLNYATWYYA